MTATLNQPFEDGATIVTGGHEVKVEGFENGYWYAPTIITDVNHSMKVVKEEIFGPVVVVMKFKDEKEVIELANDSEYGSRLCRLDEGPRKGHPCRQWNSKPVL